MKWDGAGQPGRVTAAGVGGGDNRRLATAGPAPPTDGAARAEDAPAERKVGLWMSSVGGRRQRRRQVLTWERWRQEHSDHVELGMDDGELMDEFPRGVAQLRSGVDGNDGGRLGRQRRDQSDSRHLDLFFLI